MPTPDPTRPGRSRRLTHTVLATLLTLLGVALLTYMVRVEDEPGALPLALTAAGLGWLAWARLALRPRATG